MSKSLIKVFLRFEKKVCKVSIDYLEITCVVLTCVSFSHPSLNWCKKKHKVLLETLENHCQGSKWMILTVIAVGEQAYCQPMDNYTWNVLNDSLNDWMVAQPIYLQIADAPTINAHRAIDSGRGHCRWCSLSIFSTPLLFWGSLRVCLLSASIRNNFPVSTQSNQYSL